MRYHYFFNMEIHFILRKNNAWPEIQRSNFSRTVNSVDSRTSFFIFLLVDGHPLNNYSVTLFPFWSVSKLKIIYFSFYNSEPHKYLRMNLDNFQVCQVKGCYIKWDGGSISQRDLFLSHILFDVERTHALERLFARKKTYQSKIHTIFPNGFKIERHQSWCYVIRQIHRFWTSFLNHPNKIFHVPIQYFVRISF